MAEWLGSSIYLDPLKSKLSFFYNGQRRDVPILLYIYILLYVYFLYVMDTRRVCSAKLQLWPAEEPSAIERIRSEALIVH